MINENALFAYRRTRPEIYFMVIAESGLYEAGIETKDLITAAKEGLHSVASKMEITDDDEIHGGDATLVDDYESKRLGFSMRLTHGKWLTNTELQGDLPRSSFVASLAGQARIKVIPIVLGEQRPPIEASLQALLSLQDFDYPEQPIKDRKDLPSDTRHEVRFHYQKDEDEAVHIASCRVIQTEGLLYYIEGSFHEGYESRKDAVEMAVRNVRISKPAKDPELAGLDAEEKDYEALYFNKIGIHFYAQEAFEKAVDYFKIAASLDPDDMNALSNVNSTLLDLRQYDESLRFLNQYSDHIRNYPPLMADKARLLDWAGQGYEAMKIYKKLFESGFADQCHLLTYLALQQEHEQIDEALVLLAR